MRQLVLIKHARPEVDPETPSHRWHLGPEGRNAAQALAPILRPYALTQLLTSDEPKAAQTGDILGEALAIPVAEARDLYEHDRTNVAHMRTGDFISAMEAFFRYPSRLSLGRESADECLDRFEAAVDDVLDEYPQGNLGIVTHGTVIALYVAARSRRYAFDVWRQMGQPSYVVIDLPSEEIAQLVAEPGRQA